MKIGITGASGFVGSRLIDGANRLSHRVVAFSRHPKHPVPGSIETRRYSLDQPLKIEGCQALVHLAGESILGCWTASKKRRILDSRVRGTRHLVDAIAASRDKPKILVCASGVGFYGDTGENEVDETSPPGAGFLAEVCQQWEREALRAEEFGVRTVILRLGLVIGKRGGVMRLLRPLFLLGLGARIGSGQQWMSWVHASDVAGLTLFAIEQQTVRGVLNGVSPNPSRNSEFTRALARKLHRRAFLAVPGWMVKKTLGELGGVLLSSQRVLPRAATEAGYAFRYTKL